MNTNNKHAQICKLEFVAIDDAVVINTPGSSYIKVSADWLDIPISSAEFVEASSMDNLIKQELKATITNTGASMRVILEESFAQYGLLRMTYTNGEQRILGTDQFPIEVQLEENGSPARFELIVSHESASKAKFFQSF